MQRASVDAYLPYAGASTSLHSVRFLYGVLSTAPVAKSRGGAGACRHRDSVSLSRGPVSALFVALGAQLQEQHLSPMGLRFANRVLPEYRERFCEVFGEDSWRIKDEWSHYQRIAALLVRDLYGQPPTASSSWAGRMFGKLTRLWR